MDIELSKRCDQKKKPIEMFVKSGCYIRLVRTVINMIKISSSLG